MRLPYAECRKPVSKRKTDAAQSGTSIASSKLPTVNGMTLQERQKRRHERMRIEREIRDTKTGTRNNKVRRKPPTKGKGEK